MKILYIGNQLAPLGKNPTPIDTLGEQLKELCAVVKASSKKNILLRLLHMWWVLWKYRNEAKFVLIDTYSTLNFYYALTCAFWCRLYKLPYITYLHGGKLPARLKSSPQFCNYLFGAATYIVSPSNYLAKAFRSKGYQVEVIPNNVPIALYPYQSRRIVRPNLLYVRALQQLYNPAMAVRALAKVRQKLGQGDLCFVGPDKDNSLPRLKQLAKELGVSEHIRFTGKLTKVEWVKLSINYDIFLNSTHEDNMPVSVIEAMALGLPVVTTNVGGLSDMIDDGVSGVLVPDNDDEAMANAIVSLTNDPVAANAISINARKYAEQMDWIKVKQKWMKLLFPTLES